MLTPAPLPKINFLEHDQDRSIRRHTIALAVVFSIIVAGTAAIGAGASYRAAVHGTSTTSEILQLPILADINRAMFGVAPTTSLTVKTKNDDRLNILILGIGGPGHDGALLTDTILLASVDLKENRIGFVSVPRDLAYPLGDGKFEKINAVHAYEETDHPGDGAKRTAEDFSKLFDTPIDHVVRIDFRGFVSLINAIDGIDVSVERSFTDASYPTEDDLYMTVSFKKGMQHLDGERALIFTRSRHGNNGEGSDFARSRRQQIVLMAIRTKLLSLGTLADPRKLTAIYSAISSNVETDLSVWDMIRIAPAAEQLQNNRVTMNVLTDAPDGVLVPANVGGAYMLFPKKPDWSEIRAIVQNPFLNNVERVAEAKPVEPVTLEVRNGTMRTGFASQAAAKLERNGYTITGFGNATRRGVERTVIYDLTGGTKTAETARLQKLLNAVVSRVNPSSIKTQPGSAARTIQIDPMTTERVEAADTQFLIILGDTGYAFVDSAVVPAGVVTSTD